MQVSLKPWFVFWIFGLPTAAMSFFTLVRDNFLPKEWQDELASQKFVPHWQWRTWVLILLLLWFASVVRNGFLAWRAQQERSNSLEKNLAELEERPLPATAPQVDLYSETARSLPVRTLLMRNLSRTETLFNICFQPVRLGEDGFVNWMSENKVLAPGDIMRIWPVVMERKVGDNLEQLMNGVSSIRDILSKRGSQSSYDIGGIAFSCEDSVQNRYLVTFTAEVSFGGNVFTVRDLDRRRIGSRPSRK